MQCVCMCACVCGVSMLYILKYCTYIYILTRVYVCMHACMYQAIYLSIYQSIYLSIYLSIFVPMHPCIHAACRHYIEKTTKFQHLPVASTFRSQDFRSRLQVHPLRHDRTKTAWDPNKPRHVEKPNEKPLPYSSSDVHICAIMHTHTYVHIYI